MSALQHLSKFLITAGILIAIIAMVGTYNRIRAHSAELYFEDVAPEIVTKLNLMFIPPAPAPPTRVSPKVP
jgi:hypothetical protein